MKIKRSQKIITYFIYLQFIFKTEIKRSSINFMARI